MRGCAYQTATPQSIVIPRTPTSKVPKAVTILMTGAGPLGGASHARRSITAPAAESR